MNDLPLLSAEAMASFAARGFLRFDAVVPEDLNRQFLDEMGDIGNGNEGDRCTIKGTATLRGSWLSLL